jgi:hypothetical protein
VVLFDRKNLSFSDTERAEVAGLLQEALDICSDMSDRQRLDRHQALQAADRITRWARESSRPDLAVASLKTAAGAPTALAKQANAITARDDEARQSMRLVSAQINVTASEPESWLDELRADSPKKVVGRIAFDLMSDPDFLRDEVESNAANAPLQAECPSREWTTMASQRRPSARSKTTCPVASLMQQHFAHDGIFPEFYEEMLERTKNEYIVGRVIREKFSTC